MFPTGKYSEEARVRIEAIFKSEQQAQETQRRLEKQRNVAIKKTEEKQVWEEALKENSIVAYQGYLDQYPKGEYVTTAENAISELYALASLEREREKEKKRKAKKKEEEAWNKVGTDHLQSPPPKEEQEVYQAKPPKAKPQEISQTEKRTIPWRKITIGFSAFIVLAFAIGVINSYMEKDRGTATLSQQEADMKPVKEQASSSTVASKIMKDSRRWTIENLNVKVSGSYCYADKSSNCTKYGRLYTWEAAKNACKQLGGGWRLPTDAEWEQLAMAYGGLRKYDGEWKDIKDPKAAYKSLMKGGNSDFAALLGGLRYSNGSYYDEGVDGYYWSSTEDDASSAWSYYFSSNSGKLYRDNLGKTIARSCRCIQDK